MKKIKITEKQAKLLETLNSKKVLKVTKEQYNRIIESELNRPSLTETPELHEEEINEDLFREFVNEVYGLNEEGKELRFEKVCKLMEAAGLIEGGKLVKEKFGKDARRVKEVVGKGLMKYEECGSAYEAVELMEALTDAERAKIKSGDDIMNTELKPNVDKFLEKNPDQHTIRLSAEKGDYKVAHKMMRNSQTSLEEEVEDGEDNMDDLKQKIRALGNENDENISKVINFFHESGKKNIKELDINELKDLHDILNHTNSNLEEENDLINEAPELNIDKQRLIQDIEPIESDEFNYNGLDKSTIVNFIANGRPSEYYYNTIIDTMNKLLGTNHKLDDYKIERKPMNMTITDPSKYGINPRDYGPLDEFDSTMVGGSYEGSLNQKPAFKSNVSTELEEGDYKKNYYTSPEGRDKPMHNNKIVQQLSSQAFDELFGYGAINAYRENGEKFTDTQWYNGEWKTNKNFAEHILRTVTNITNRKGLSPSVIMVHFLMDSGKGIKGRTHAERTYEKYFNNLNESKLTSKIYEALKKK